MLIYEGPLFSLILVPLEQPCICSSLEEYTVILSIASTDEWSRRSSSSHGASAIRYHHSLVDSWGCAGGAEWWMRYLVDEVEGIEGPSIRQLLGLYAGLLAEDLVTDLFSVAADVRTLSQHELVGHDSHCEIVGSVRTVFMAKDIIDCKKPK